MEISSVYDIENEYNLIPLELREGKIFNLYAHFLSSGDIVSEVRQDTDIGRWVRSAGDGFLTFLITQQHMGKKDLVKNYIHFWIQTMPIDMRVKKFVDICGIECSPMDIFNEIENDTPFGKKLYENEKYVITALGNLKEFR